MDRQAYWQPIRVSGIVRRPSYASYPPLPLGQGGDTYFDDNTWVALDLVQAHRMRVAGLMGGRAVALERARALFELVSAGWCRDPRPYPGGVYWVDAAWNRDRGAAVTAGLAALALHLHELTTPETMPASGPERARSALATWTRRSRRTAGSATRSGSPTAGGRPVPRQGARATAGRSTRASGSTTRASRSRPA